MSSKTVIDDGDDIIVDESLRIPRNDCTRDAFFRHLPQLGIRDLLCWALRTETTLRLSKINRENYSKVLDSNYLIDIYPTDGDDTGLKSDATPKGHDEFKFSRKVHPQLTFMEEQTEDYNGLTPIEIEKKKNKKKRFLSSSDEYGYGSHSDDGEEEEEEEKAFDERQVVPPTLLHFEIILEAFMGYSLGAGTGSSCYNSHDSSIPRAAVMGGAVVAALTSYQDKIVVETFERSNIFSEEGSLQEDRIYWGAKIELIKELHSHFTYKKTYKWSKDPPCSRYAKGDVDIFLQSSPLTQSLMNVFSTRGISQEQVDMIGAYIGNVGICEKDLELYVTKVMGEDGDGVITAPDETQFAFAVSKRAVSFILGAEDMYENPGLFSDTVWPRSSQFIMLDTQADLLGALLDFDLSVVACSYDGISVRVAPRAALSLMTTCNFVTPFCFEGI